MYEYRAIPSEYIQHIGCAIKVHSIMNSGLIPGGQILRKRRTVFSMLVNPLDEEHKDQLKTERLENKLRLCGEDEWNHLLCLVDISHCSSTNCSEVMLKRTQKDSGEERVTAKSKPMMNLVSRCSERILDMLASAASESPGKTKSESQEVPLSSSNEQQLRTGRFVLDASSSNYSEWNADKNRSSQEWKSDELMEV